MNGRETLEEKARLGRGRAHTVELTNRESAVFAGVADVEKRSGKRGDGGCSLRRSDKRASFC